MAIGLKSLLSLGRKQRPLAYYEKRLSGQFSIWLYDGYRYEKVSTATSRRHARGMVEFIDTISAADRERLILRIREERAIHTRLR